MSITVLVFDVMFNYLSIRATFGMTKKWPLSSGGRYSEVVINTRLTLYLLVGLRRQSVVVAVQEDGVSSGHCVLFQPGTPVPESWHKRYHV